MKMKPKWRVYWIDGATTIQEGTEPKTGAVVCRVERIVAEMSDKQVCPKCHLPTWGISFCANQPCPTGYRPYDEPVTGRCPMCGRVAVPYPDGRMTCLRCEWEEPRCAS